MLAPIESQEAALGTIQTLIDAAGDEIEELSVVVGASAGVSYSPDHGITVAELLAAADRALYAAKRAGRGRARVAD
ncbi:MAG: diguanylate cyclase [Chloroflexi bacterium]|nr:diguanylate cyclase [Chloroflexota bacterium]